MMFPWDNPQFLTRVWCVFEAFTASTEPGCTLTIAMSPKEKQAMMSALGNVDNLFKVLNSTMIQNAKAFAPDDRDKILKLVEETVGYTKFNQSINNLIRRWVMDLLVAEFEKMNGSKDMRNNHDGDNEKLSRLCYIIGTYMYANGKDDEALVYFKKGLKEILNPTVDQKLLSADIDNSIGTVYHKKGDYDNASVNYRKALEIRLEVLGPDHPITAGTYNNIGSAYYLMGCYENALAEYRKCLEIRLKGLETDHPEAAGTYSNLGTVYCAKGDYDYALVEFSKALEIQLKVHGPDHPRTAESHHSIGGMYHQKGDHDNALIEFSKALEIQLKVLGPNHSDTIRTRKNIKIAVSML
jgi:tetratricopeptide (TPR) repeat protein